MFPHAAITRRGEIKVASPQYLAQRQYADLLLTLARARDDDQIKIALGEVANVWPASIKFDAMEAPHERKRRVGK
jgi:hypothetical protein